MSLPFTPTKDGSPGLDDIRAQSQGQALAGFGQVIAVPLSSLQLSTDTVGSTLTAPSSAILRVTLLGNLALFALDTYGQLTLSGGTCTRLKIRLPFGLRAANREPVSGGPDLRHAITPCMIIDPGAGFVSGYFTLEGSFLTVTRFSVTAFTAGTGLGVYGQVWGEVIRPDEA